jgi:N-acetylmuramoyl-L-alanine amidase
MALLWTACLFWPGAVLAENRILNIRHWVAPDHTRVVIDTGEEAIYRVEKQERRLVVHLEGTSFPPNLPAESVLNKPGLERIRLLFRGKTEVGVELALPPEVQTTVFTLKPFQDKPHRVVIDIVLPEIARKESEAREQIKMTRKNRIIVIDPGHGGEAVGAVGKGGTMEKDVVLAISRKLRDLLNARSGYRAFLTRDGDYYVSFRKRLMIAREYGADLFVSIHADAARNRAAAGSSVYCLSTGGAVSAAAKILASSENLADVVGGVSNGEGSDASDPIILSMTQTHAINQSKTFGNTLLRNIGAVSRLKFPAVQEAPFIVLKLPEIPSVLVETAYISNLAEEKLLSSGRFQTRMAESIMLSVTKFLPPMQAVPVILAGGKGPGVNPSAASQPAAAEVPLGKQPPAEEGKPLGQAGGQTAGPVITMAATGVSAGEATVNAVEASSGTPPGEASRQGGLGAYDRTESPAPPEKVKPAGAADVQLPPARSQQATQSPLPEQRVAGAPTLANAREAQPGTKGKPFRAAPGPGEPKAEPVREPQERRGPETGGLRKAAVAPAGGKTFPYRVRNGESLERIARRYGTTASALARLNGINPGDPLFIGRLLKIPGEASTASQPKIEPGQAPPEGGMSVSTQIQREPSPLSREKTFAYRVRNGESLERIARRYGTTVGLLARLNGLDPGAPLFVGKLLKIPRETRPAEGRAKGTATEGGSGRKGGAAAAEEQRYYRVRKGDTLDTIARRHGTTVETIAELNKLKRAAPLYVDRKLLLPGGASL